MLKHFFIVLFLFPNSRIVVSQSLELITTGYDMHIEASWSSLPAANHYQLYRKAPGNENFTLYRTTTQERIQDWTGRTSPTEGPYSYYVNALNLTGDVLASSDTLEASVFEINFRFSRHVH